MFMKESDVESVRISISPGATSPGEDGTMR